MGFYSFEKLLRQALQSFKEQDIKILEWGPGYSTGIMLQEKPQCIIHTFEHSQWWYDNWVKRYKDQPNVYMYYKPGLEEYVKYPLKMGVKFDMAFVDGRERVSCLYTVKEVVKPDGLVLLHDSERDEYQEGMALFRTIAEHDFTTLMMPSLKESAKNGE